MRIQRSTNPSSSSAVGAPAAASSSSSSSTSPSPSGSSSTSSSPSSFSSCFSSTHSTISTRSLTSSSSHSTSLSSFPNSPTQSPIRCQGLDLLVKAAYYVAGSVVGVPYIQRRVIRRRKRAIRFANLVVKGFLKVEEQPGGGVGDGQIEAKSNKKRATGRKRKNAGMGLEYPHSDLRRLKPPRNPKHRSGKIETGSDP